MLKWQGDVVIKVQVNLSAALWDVQSKSHVKAVASRLGTKAVYKTVKHSVNCFIFFHLSELSQGRYVHIYLSEVQADLLPASAFSFESAARRIEPADSAPLLNVTGTEIFLVNRTHFGAKPIKTEGTCINTVASWYKLINWCSGSGEQWNQNSHQTAQRSLRSASSLIHDYQHRALFIKETLCFSSESHRFRNFASTSLPSSVHLHFISFLSAVIL